MFKITTLSRKLIDFTSLMIVTSGILLISDMVQAKTTDIISYREEQNKVTLRLKVTDKVKDKYGKEKTIPIMDLKKKDFKLQVTDMTNDKLVAPSDTDKGYSDIPFKFKNPLEAEPPPAYILVLLDMSGSMNCSTDLDSKGVCNNAVPEGKRKLDAALSALTTFIEEAKKRGGNTNVAIIPFGYGFDYKPIENLEDLNKLYSVSDSKTTAAITNLQKQTPRAATNIYHTLGKAVEFFTNPPTDELKNKFYPFDEKKSEPIEPKPRLAVILLSDGFDTQYDSRDEKKARQLQKTKLEEIKGKLADNPQITIHTLGYGLNAEQLQKKFGTSQWSEINRPPSKDNGKIPSGKIPSNEYLDVDGLEQISKITTPNGLFAISGNSEEIASSLRLFLDAILGEYEVTYTHPNPQRGRLYKTSVTADNISSEATECKQSDIEKKNQCEKSSFIEYRGVNFGRTASFSIWVISAGLLLISGIVWFCFYWWWRKKIEDEERGTSGQSSP
ncbi:MAG: VWA domain-containing protein [Microcystis sp. LE19-84.1B]|uniref:vWA domain-containing protein n=1 Tax=Microcystis sp. LE19-84.1B TaxID=3016438 RepID=UPI0022C2ED55|nr:vWA domain-containing protein [Microcystis sp. LE19-84.1B]MCZ8223676.1 VWA domain-containing protein [Microcystis sp. LE19-84.1B]